MNEYEQYQCSPEADRSPYVVHHSGPDDVLPARSWFEAVAVAHSINIAVAEYTRRTEHPGMVRSWATPYLRADAERAGITLPEPTGEPS